MNKGKSDAFYDLEEALMHDIAEDAVPSYIQLFPPGAESGSSNSKNRDTESVGNDRSASTSSTASRLAHLRAAYHDGSYQAARCRDHRLRTKVHGSIAEECARRSCFTLATHESKIKAPKDIEVAASLAHLPFDDGWISVFRAFSVGESEPYIKCLSADESFNSYLVARSPGRVETAVVREYLQMVLQGSQPTARVREVVRNPPEQADVEEPLAFFSLGQCLQAVPVVFSAILSERLKDLSDIRRGNLNDSDWSRLLNTAKSQVLSLLKLATDSLRLRYPGLSLINSCVENGIETDSRLLVHQCLQQALTSLFDHSLGMLYRRVYAATDESILIFARKECSNISLESIARKLALGDDGLSRTMELNEKGGSLERFRKAIERTCSPAIRLSSLVDAMQELGNSGLSSEQLLVSAAATLLKVVGQSAQDIHLASMIFSMDDFALPSEVKDHGRDAYTLAMLLTALQMIMEVCGK